LVSFSKSKAEGDFLSFYHEKVIGQHGTLGLYDED
jgi:hypothetical protein